MRTNSFLPSESVHCPNSTWASRTCFRQVAPSTAPNTRLGKQELAFRRQLQLARSDWLPINYLLIEALERYYRFYGESLKVECPTGSGRWMNLQEGARESLRA